MAVGYQGDTTNFSGVGAPNPKLWVPQINNIEDTNTKEALLKIQQWCQNLVSPSIDLSQINFSQTYSVSGTLQVASGGTGYLPPFFMPLGAGQTVSLYAVRAEVRSGSCTVEYQHNGSNIATGVAVGTSPSTTTVSATVANNDTFQVVVTAVSSADGLSCSFYFELT
jgi:hypothetical protein